MSEIKSNKEIIFSNIDDYAVNFVSSIIQQNDSIETYPLYSYCFDLLIVHLCGILEQKYRALRYIKAEIDLDERYWLYRDYHATTVEMHEVYKEYENEYKEEIECIKKGLINRSKKKPIDFEKQYKEYLFATAEEIFNAYSIKYNKISQRKAKYKDFKNIILSINNKNNSSSIKTEDLVIYSLHIKFEEINKFFENIVETFKLNKKLGSTYSEFKDTILYLKINKFIKDKDNYYNGIYDTLLNTYKEAYKYRNSVAHNIEFGKKVDSVDFNLLKDSATINKFGYMFAIMVVDKIIINIYNHFEMRQIV